MTSLRQAIRKAIENGTKWDGGAVVVMDKFGFDTIPGATFSQRPEHRQEIMTIVNWKDDVLGPESYDETNEKDMSRMVRAYLADGMGRWYVEYDLATIIYDHLYDFMGDVNHQRKMVDEITDWLDHRRWFDTDVPGIIADWLDYRNPK